MMLRALFGWFLILFSCAVWGQSPDPSSTGEAFLRDSPERDSPERDSPERDSPERDSPERDSPEREWVDSLMQAMSTEEKIGQLLMVAVFPEQGPAHLQSIQALIQAHHLGGLVMMQGDMEKQLRLLNHFQQTAKYPLLIAQDAEWGASMRLKDAPGFPKALTLGAVRNDSLIYQMGRVMGEQLRALGVQVNFAPVFDVNTRPENPVINYRSFGENHYNVARKGIFYGLGLQESGVLACAKHFPGHGDTDTDSHHALPLIPHDQERLDTVELYPFSKAVQTGLGGVMVGHLYVPALDSVDQRPASLSPPIVNGILRERMGFERLVFTDALNMKGVSQGTKPGEVEVKALQAGNDVLVFPENVPVAVEHIQEALQKQELSLMDLDEKVRRVLQAKYRLGLDTLLSLPTDRLGERVFTAEARVLTKRLYESALTLVQNEGELVPLEQLSTRKVAYVQVAGGSLNAFDKNLRKYAEIERFYLRPGFTAGERRHLLESLEAHGFNTVILGIFGMNQRRGERYGLTDETISLCASLQQAPMDLVTCLFGNPYALEFLPKQQALLLAYEPEPEAARAAASAVFGGIPIRGRLPVQASAAFPEGTGLQVEQAIRFGFAYPEEEGLDSRVMQRIDSIAEHYVHRRAMPGCAILVIKGNNIVYEKGFGYAETSHKAEPVDPYLHTYDLASLTKVAATTLITMQLVEKGWLNLDKPLEAYLPELRYTNKAKLTPRRLLQHNAGLPSWIPFFWDTFEDMGQQRGQLNPLFCSHQPSPSHPIQIAPNLYVSPELQDSLWRRIVNVDVRNTHRVRYSDVGMILLGRVIEAVSGLSIEQYTENLFYEPMGMNNTLFNPAKKGRGRYCPPTQRDTLWRKCTVQGYVHDETAAMLGGTAGHAGLFANVYDLGKLMMMLKNGGMYGTQSFLSDTIIQQFTSRQLRSNRKGLGWDKPAVREWRSNPVSRYCSAETFGHTGFTGTSAWVDPTFDIIYVFLANRTYPNTNNRLLQRENVRVLIMDQIYEAMFSYQQQKL